MSVNVNAEDVGIDAEADVDVDVNLDIEADLHLDAEADNDVVIHVVLNMDVKGTSQLWERLITGC